VNCPKCNGHLEVVRQDTIEIDRCTNCGGLWFDMLEMERLRKVKGAKTVDSGDASVGAEKNKVGDILCPRDKARMIRMVDLEQYHIWYESCPVCYGKWLDAGEFRDLVDETIFDLFKRLFARERA
jgi:Zn-finger nucleic acid-binding protein